MAISMTKAAILEQLQQRLKAAESEDAKNAAAHAKSEQAALKKFRTMLKAAAKWDYARLKAHDFHVGMDYRDRPACPLLHSKQIKKQIQAIKLDERKANFNVYEGGDLFAAMTWEPATKKTVCD